MQVVDPTAQLFRSLGEDALCGPLEKQERRATLERGIGRDELGIALLECSEVMLLVLGQPLEDFTTARIVRQRRSPRVELEAAALGGYGDAQRVACEHQFGR